MRSCWNGEVVRIAVAIDTDDREIIAWVAISGGGISGEMIRDMMLDCVERPALRQRRHMPADPRRRGMAILDGRWHRYRREGVASSLTGQALVAVVGNWDGRLASAH